MTDYPGYIYAAAISLGGIFGYIKAGSLPSLFFGLTFGVLAAYGANRASNNPRDVLIAFLVSLVLLIVMGIRFFKTGKFMPAGLVAALSLIYTIRYGYRYTLQ
ncbi:TMEM14-domain-containing protein [Gigaspora margarita]|uniref:TMEM14-domain-containing protein n=1 Tax=Gigaspora margarita TaxID=4874 RepID=A0A8H3X462_GIGMA|nr:TMEM14-domain-containing protein [Gigaspora margarita]